MNKKTKEMDKYKNITNFDQLIEVEHGKIGTESRNEKKLYLKIREC